MLLEFELCGAKMGVSNGIYGPTVKGYSCRNTLT